MKSLVRGIFLLVMGVLLASAVTKGFRFKEPPPGTVFLTDSLFIDRQPVRVVDYLEFLSAIRNSYSSRIHDSLKDIPHWGYSMQKYHRMLDNTPWDSMYYVHMLPRIMTTYVNGEEKYDVDFHIKNPSYYPYPVVNLNYIQVREYCKWRTDMVKMYYAIKCKTEKARRKYPMNFEYRLPTRDEWELAIGKFLNKVEREDKLKYSNKMLHNIGQVYEKKPFFQYQSDNVGELLDAYLVTMGFTWNEKMHIGTIKYTAWEQPADWVGFRCVCKVLPKDGSDKPKAPQVIRDKFGKIISKPTETTQKKQKKEEEMPKAQKPKSEKTKQSKQKAKPESMKKKRRRK